MVASGKTVAVVGTKKKVIASEGMQRFFASFQDAEIWVIRSRRFTPGYHLSAALRQSGILQQLLIKWTRTRKLVAYFLRL